MNSKRILILTIPIVFLSGTAFANAGTPLMWAVPLHLAFGNLFIGIGEGLLLGFIFRAPKLKSIGIMILANYLSACSGYFILKALQPSIDNSITIYEIHTFCWVVYGIAFLFTLIVEMPFIFIVMRKKEHAIRLTLIASLVIQSVSYCVIFYWYRAASYDSLFRNAQIVKSFDFQHPESTLYYLSEDKSVYEMCLDGSECRKIYDPNNKQELMKLYLRNCKTGINLYVCHLTDFYTEWEENQILVKENVLPIEQYDALNIKEEEMVMKQAIDYRPQSQRQWQIWTGFWAAQGLEIWNESSKELYSVALETPFAQWYVRSATVLPGDEVIFQLGNQICIYSRPTKQLYLLAKGTSPVVVFDKPPVLETTKED